MFSSQGSESARQVIYFINIPEVLFPTLYWLLVARETFTSDQFEQYSNFGETNHPAATAQDCKRSPSVKNQFLPPVWLANVLRLPKISDGLVYPMCLVISHLRSIIPITIHRNISVANISCISLGEVMGVIYVVPNLVEKQCCRNRLYIFTGKEQSK